MRDFHLRSDPNAEYLLAMDTLSEVDAWEQQFSERSADLKDKLAMFESKLQVAQQQQAAEEPDADASNELSPSSWKLSSKSSPSPVPSRSLTADLVQEEDAKIAALERTMNQLNGMGGPSASLSPMPSGLAELSGEPEITPQDSLAFEQLDRLDRIMERATYLQFPELAEQELKERSAADGKHIYPIGKSSATDQEVRYFGSGAVRRDSVPPSRSGFYSDQDATDDFEQVTVGAAVHSDATVMDGSTVKMRLLDDVYLAGQRIPRHTFVFASASLRGDRLQLRVQSINFRGNIYTVDLHAYDLDGQRGIAVPGAIERQIAKREGARAVRGGRLGNTGVGVNLTTQLAADGTQAIKEIASQKLSVIKVNVKAQHRIILRNE
jgi:conjugative transposon TraM protein